MPSFKIRFGEKWIPNKDMFKNKLQKTAIFGTFCTILRANAPKDQKYGMMGVLRNFSFYA